MSYQLNLNLNKLITQLFTLPHEICSWILFLQDNFLSSPSHLSIFHSTFKSIMNHFLTLQFPPLLSEGEMC